MALAENLQALRSLCQFTCEYVAASLHTTAAAITSYEAGQATPDPQMLTRLADLYGCTTEVLHAPAYEFACMQRLAAGGVKPVETESVLLVLTLDSSVASLERGITQLRQVQQWLGGGGEVDDKSGLKLLLPQRDETAPPLLIPFV